MSTTLATLSNKKLSMWEDSERLNEIRKLFAPKLSADEFTIFIGLGKATGLNPFLREIWSVKYSSNAPAQIFIGRDGYRKAAQAHHDYEWHEPDSIHENDVFEKINGEIHHKYNLKDRGALIGAYCLVKRKSAARAVCVRVDFSEYNTNQSLWKTKPETMIKKVAEAQALRGCFQDLLGGTYGEEEMHKEQPKHLIIEGETQTERLTNLLKQTETVVDFETGEVVQDNSENPNSSITSQQMDEIFSLMKEKNFAEDRESKAIQYVLKQNKVENLLDLSQDAGQLFINQLRKL